MLTYILHKPSLKKFDVTDFVCVQIYEECGLLLGQPCRGLHKYTENKPQFPTFSTTPLLVKLRNY